MTQLYNRQGERAKRKRLRNEMTPEEVILWAQLKRRHLNGFKFRRQYSIGPYIVDFYCPEARLVIEVDGGGHFTDEGIANDRIRQQAIENCGIHFLRFTNTGIRDNLYEVVSRIAERLAELT